MKIKGGGGRNFEWSLSKIFFSIPSAQRDHAGVYYCVADNLVGELICLFVNISIV